MADAILANDADAAVFWMRQHILRSKKDALKQFDGQSDKA
jgi:DNA-binding GntR family transcriptional regulator